MKHVLPLICCSIFPALAPGQEKPLPDIAEIMSAWAEREDRFAHLRVSWDETIIFPAGSRSNDPVQRIIAVRKGEKPQEKVIPPKDMVLKVGGEMRFSGKSVWYSRSRPLWSGDHCGIVTDTASWDGKVGRRFTPEGVDSKHPRGRIRQSAADVEMFDPLFLPVWINARGGGKTQPTL